MINLMYLVLTAMLALNVSAKIINAFFRWDFNSCEAILKDGGSAIDAVEQTIHSLEESTLFNAGRGAVFTNEGRNEMDASIMSGADRMAGAVGGVTNVKHPISAARAVMEESPHVLLTGRGAEQFAQQSGLEIVEPSYFYTQRRWDALQRAIEREHACGFWHSPATLANRPFVTHPRGLINE